MIMLKKVIVCIVLCFALQQVADSLAIDSKSQATSNSIPQTVTTTASTATTSVQQQVSTTIEPPPRQHNDYLPEDNRRPIWNLAHMVNSIKELDYRLA